MSHPPGSVWRGNLMTHTEIIAVQATLVQIGFWKLSFSGQFRIDIHNCETIFFEMVCELLNSTKK
jgi:hypothetical protein